MGAKEQTFELQRQKYQARYNEAADELTAANAELAKHAAALQGVQTNLQLLGKALETRVAALVSERTVNLGKLIQNTLLCLPIRRFFKKAGLLVIIGVLVGAYYLWSDLNAAALVLALLALMGVQFFIERSSQLKGAMAIVHQSSAKLHDLGLAYIYDDQVPQSQTGAAAYHLISVFSNPKTAPLELTLAPVSWGVNMRPDSFLLYIADIAVYRVERDGNIAQIFANPASPLMNFYGAYLNQALLEQKAFAGNTLEPLAAYGKAAWRKKKATLVMPQLEKLVRNVDRIENLWRPVAVSDKNIDFLVKRIDLFNIRDRATPPGILLYGSEGNGKAFLARKIADSIEARFVAIDGSTLTSADEVKKLWQGCRGRDPIVLFIDAAERVFPAAGSQNQGSGTRETTMAWATEWGKFEAYASRVWVILSAATDSNKEIDQQILSRVAGSKAEIGAPDQTGCELILRKACSDNQLPVELPSWLVEDSRGMRVRDLLQMVNEAKLQSLPNPPDDATWRNAMRTVRDPGGTWDPNATWENLVLPDPIIDKLKTVCRILRDADRYKAKGARVPNLLLFGPPGTGKTQIARTIANMAGVPFIAADSKDMKAGYVGQSVGMVHKKFQEARDVAPSVLFIDEIEVLCGDRNNPAKSDGFTKEIVDQMLQEMDGVKDNSGKPIFVLAATNILGDIDGGIRSRFGEPVEIPLPDEKGRTRLLKIEISKVKALDPSMDIDEVSAALAQKTAGKGGRDLQKLVQNAVEYAITRGKSADDFLLTREDLMYQIKAKDVSISEDQLQQIWADIVLPAKVKDTILSKIRLFNRGDEDKPKGLLLYGPPGTGKTEIARCIQKSTGSYFMNKKAADLKAGYIGQSGQAVKGLWDEAKQHGRTIMFVDECDAVFGKRTSFDTDQFGKEIVDNFIAYWDGLETGQSNDVWVVGATNHKDLLDEAVMSRFGTAIEINPPDAAGRLQILALEMKKVKRNVTIPTFLGEATTGLSGRDLKLLAQGVRELAGGPDREITPEMWRAVVDQLRGSRSDVPPGEGGSWDTLILPDSMLETLKTTCSALRQIETIKKQGLEPPRATLLFGKPGTGKTQIARTLANESGVGFVAAGPSDVKAGYVGQSAPKVHALFEKARSQAPCILFIDEIESAFPQRGGSHSDQVTGEIVDQALTELDGVKKTDRFVFLLGATNHPELIDDAILSRFPDKIEVPYPDQQQRQKILQVLLAKKPVNFDVAAVSAELAAATPNFSGRDLRSLVDNASKTALARALAEQSSSGKELQIVISREDVVRLLKPKDVSISEEELQQIWSEIVLPAKVKDAILSKIRLFNGASDDKPKGLLLYGPPGTGKTEIARCIKRSTGSYFMDKKAPDLKAGYVGQSGNAVKALWEEAKSHGRTIMFIDECDAVFSQRTSMDTDGAIKEIVNSFIAYWDGVETGQSGDVWVVGATNHKDLLDEAVMSRFGTAIEINPPDAAGRMEILRLEMKKKVKRDFVIPAFMAEATTGLSGRDLKLLAQGVRELAGDPNNEITEQMWRTVVERLKGGRSDVAPDGARWDSLILPDAMLKKFKTTCRALRQIEVIRKQNIAPPRAILLYGKPGTGKTQIARTMANESGVTFIAAGPSDVKAGYVGQSAPKVHALFERARGQAPCILFIDEIEAAFPQRGGAHADQFAGEIVDQVLTELDGVKKTDRFVFLLGATNHPELIDDAILSRFPDKIEVPYPNASERGKILQVLIAKKPVDFDVAQVSAELATMTDNFSGRDLWSVVENASQAAMTRAFDADDGNSGDIKIVLSREDLISQIAAAADAGQAAANA